MRSRGNTKILNTRHLPENRGTPFFERACSIAIPLLVLTSALIMTGCSSLRLGRPVIKRPTDWPMFAMTTSRLISIAQPLTPPLVPEWDQDVQGGTGNGSPLVVDSLVFVANLRGDLHVINARTGKRLGSVNLGEAIQGSPVIDGNVALVALSNTRESLVAFDITEGQIRWKREYGDIEVSPLLVNQKIYIGTTDGVFSCIERFSGDLVWKFSIPDNALAKGIRSSPASNGSSVIFGSDNGFVYALDPVTGRLRWKIDTGAPVMATPCIVDGTVYIGNLDGTLFSLDLSDGAVRWRFHTGSSLYATVSIADSFVVVGTTGGSLFALRTGEGSLAWKIDVGGPVNSTAVPAGGILYVGTLKRRLLAIRASDGAELWSTEVQGRIKTTPAIANGRLYVTTDERTLLSFRGSAP